MALSPVHAAALWGLIVLLAAQPALAAVGGSSASSALARTAHLRSDQGDHAVAAARLPAPFERLPGSFSRIPSPIDREPVLTRAKAALAGAWIARERAGRALASPELTALRI